MTYPTTDTGPGGSMNVRLLRWLLGGGALAAAILLAGLGLSASTVQAQVGRLYSGSIDVVDANCGGGAIDVTRSPDGMSVVAVVLLGVEQTNADGSPSGSGFFDPGAVPIGADGSFSTTFDASDVPPPDGVSPPNGVAGHTITVTGTFTDDTVTGTVTVSPSTCGSMPFSAEVHPPPAGALVFEGHFEPIFDFLPQPDGDGVPDCGGGDVVFIVTPDRTEIFSVEFSGNTIAGLPRGHHTDWFELGEVPIDENGHFSREREVREVSADLSIRNVGSFNFDADPQTLIGTHTAFFTSLILCEQDYTATHQVEAVAVPSSGTGATTGSGSSMTLWALLAASLGALTLAAGLALRRHA